MAGLYKRGKTWWGRAQRQNREFRRSLKTKDKAIAFRRFRAWLDELDKVGYGEKPARSFADAAERFATEQARVLRPSSARRYKVSLMHLIDHMGELDLAKIGKAVLSDFETKRRSQGVSAPTIRRDLACLSSVLGHAVDWEWIDVNPVPAFLRRRSRKGLKEAPGRRRYLTRDEEAALLLHATPDVRRGISFAIDTGLRLEEQFALTWERVDIARARIVLGRETKTGIPRDVPFIGRTAQILAQMPRHIRCPYVFWHDDGQDGARRYNNMEKGLKAAARRAGVKDLRWHDLRRTFGCRRLQEDGLSKAEVQELLGHASIVTTEKSYAFLDVDKIQAALTKPGTGVVD